MASANSNNSQVNSPVANPTNSPAASPVANPAASAASVPDYLDFNDLRNEGITHLGNLTGKIWTDYNLHDPGITILEALCYALLDLDYRAKLPASDIFSRNPLTTGPDDNFYSPAQILACNPLTIIDYRKLLSDIEGVRNAWLEVATDQGDTCLPVNRQKALENEYTGNCQTFLNGLYHVYIETEDGTDDQTVSGLVRQALMSHRNLCEDIVDITVLGKQPLGVCAIVELNTDADPAQVYLDMMQQLGDFLSPSPHFYTLQQLLDLGKPIDAIFAGRPYNTSVSHGFIDTGELQQIQLKKEIHLSDLYKILFEVTGIKTIRDLQWKTCGDNGKISNAWKFNIPENNVVDFSISCCGIQFISNGKPLSFDPTQYDALVQAAGNKNLYTTALPNLDLPFPKGNYRDDLADYYSIQNDFPNAYGIAKGGVPADAPTARKAWALQLKGFLLFFDQLLADYLAQLSNIRTLFSLGAAGSAPAAGSCNCQGPAPSGSPSGEKTYFLNPLTNGDDPEQPNYVPDVDKLWRSFVDDDLAALLGDPGSTLVFPVSLKTLLQQPAAGQPADPLPGDLSALDYAGWDELHDVITRLKADFDNSEGLSCQYVTSLPNCIWYYIGTSSADMALVSKKTFTKLADAQRHAAYVISCGMMGDSYSLFSIAGDQFTFTMEYNATPLSDILQAELEDSTLNIKRRQYFLDHLLARFAERFTNYALLQYGPADPLQKARDQLRVEENFLSGYAVLSSSRGQAGDYGQASWDTDNISGFEKKWKALVGLDDSGRHSLCNFAVQKFEAQYSFSLKINDKTFFAPDEKFDSEATARQAATALLKALADRSGYSIRESAAQSYTIGVSYAEGHTAWLADSYPSEVYANTIGDRLSALFAQRPPREDVFISAYMYKPKLMDYAGKPVTLSLKFYNSAEEAMHMTSVSLDNQPPDPAHWQPAGDDNKTPGTLYRNTRKPDILQFIDLDAFQIDINNDIIDRPDKFTYNLLPITNAFKFQAVDEFENADDAGAHALELLLLATEPVNYWVEKDATGTCIIWITGAGRRQAGCNTGQDNEEEAQKQSRKIQDQFRHQLYTVEVGKEPYRWKFHYHLGYEDSGRLHFDSAPEYDSADGAMEALRSFWQSLPVIRLQPQPGGLSLLTDDPAIPAVFPTPGMPASAGPAPDVPAPGAPALLKLQQAIHQAVTGSNPNDYAQTKMDEKSQQGQYTWQLVDKDRSVACCTRDYSDKASAAADRDRLAGLLQQGVKYLEICLDGKIVRRRKDPRTGKYGYHYFIKCHNCYYSSGRPMILFESVAGYATEAAARQALADNYLSLLEWAARDSNYGTLISLTELISNNPPATPIVFVPKETKVALGGADADVIKKLVTIAGSYPLKRVEYNSAEFTARFCNAATPPVTPVAPTPCGAPKTYVYYCGLSIPDPSSGPFEWQSTCWFTTIAEAQIDFAGFMRLLKYPGNLFSGPYECPGKGPTYRIYIHEVLAESANRFATEEDAWGMNGVEKFICATRDQEAIISYQAADCSNTFLVNCGSPILQHPCTYSSPKKRDEAKEKLFSQFEKWNPRSFTAYRETSVLVLTDGQAVPFAKAPITDEGEGDACLATDLIIKIYDDSNRYGEKDGYAQLTSADGATLIAQSYQTGVKAEEWKEQMRQFAGHYPLVKTDDGRFSIEIKLPDFPDSSHSSDSPDSLHSPDSSCYIAWKSSCLYNTCEQAQKVLEQGRELLAHSDYYLPTFTSDCRCFGIVLSDPNDKIAAHPQSYISRETVTDAMVRTKKAVNTEGLHIVEHILLRPAAGQPEDCGCRGDMYCNSQPDCGFQWEVAGTDPCQPVNNICFIPGNDPYSFIATVVLPAWPATFSSPDNRIVLENILYHEAPAHVLLRVLWLTPQDCCLFETQYKGWLKWMAGQKKGGGDFAVCDFIQFLFRKDFAALDDCQNCHPCPAPVTTPDPCAGNLNSSRASQPPVFSGQVSQLYCWTGKKEQ